MKLAAVAEDNANTMLSDLEGADHPIARLTESIVIQKRVAINATSRTAGITISNSLRPPVFGIRKPSSSSV
jgi:ribosomal protein L32E